MLLTGIFNHPFFLLFTSFPSPDLQRYCIMLEQTKQKKLQYVRLTATLNIYINYFSFQDGITYYKLSSCSLIESTLPPLIYALVIFYGISCLVSFISCFLLSALLCLPVSPKRPKPKRKSNKVFKVVFFNIIRLYFTRIGWSFY